eukprot:TRINITY_DN3030_c4_g19_i1.p1 TRINITY_DN3030_c4_g19~~TRINITY_DN3030_c4_g19_i1.p1  ORF type:complete len:406 (-),score=91.15 TRINITY_DN3030_c4_g19_i1:438-1655(-)
MSSKSIEELIRERIYDMFPFKIDESCKREIDGVHCDHLYACVYSPNGEYLVIGDYNKAHVIDVAKERLHCTLKDHTQHVFDIAFTEDGQLMATCSNDRTIIIYRLVDFSIARILHNDYQIYGICFSHCSNYIYSCDNGGTLKKWDVNNDAAVLKSKVLSRWILQLKLSLSGEYILIPCSDHTTRLINSENFSVIREYNENTDVLTVDFHPTKRIIAIGNYSNNIRLLNMDDGGLLHSFHMGRGLSKICFLTPKVLIVMSRTEKVGSISLLDVEKYEKIQKVGLTLKETAFDLCKSLLKGQLACGICNNNTIQIFPIVLFWDLLDQNKLIELSKDRGFVLSNLINMGVNARVVRNLVGAGIHMNQQDYFLSVDYCWDLIDLNEANGGNMRTFVNEQCDETDDDDDD